MEKSDLKVRHVDWYFDEWIAGTSRLDVVERGVYVTICNMIYSAGGPIDSEGLASACKCHGTSFKRAINRLKKLGKIIENGSQIDVKRCEKELEKARIRLANARENGGKGGRPPKKINTLPKPVGYSGEKLARASSNLPTTNHQPIKSPNGLFVQNAFDQWWGGYPHKIGKLKAKTAFAKALKKTALDVLIAGLERYKATKPEWQEWCMPTTWLNNERWNDAPAGPVTNGHTNGRLDDAGMLDGPTEPPPEIEGFEFPVGRPH